MSESQLLQKAPAKKPAAAAKAAPAGPQAHRAVQRAAAPAWAAASAGAPFALAGPVQAKVAIGAPGDTWEREADQVAQRVTTGGGASTIRVSPVGPGSLAPLQRAPVVDEEQADGAVQRMGAADEADEAPVQPLRRVQRQPASAPAEEDDAAVQRQASTEEVEEEAPAPLQALSVQRQAAAAVPEDDAPEDAGAAGTVQRAAAAGAAPPPEVDEEPDAVAQPKRHPGAMGGAARLDAQLRSPGAGSPLPRDVRARVEPVLGADLSGVRVHDDGPAQAAAQSIHARAFTHGAGIWLGRGESAGDVGLMAHEAAHVVQQGAAGGQRQSAAAAGDAIQGWIPDWVLEELNDYARHIPGWTLFTVVIGYNPLLGQDVERNAINLLGGLMGLIPFGTAIFDALNEHGIIQAAFDWVNAELSRLDLSLDRIERTIDAAWDEVGITNSFSENLEIVQRHFGALYDDAVAFATSVVSHVMEMIKEAVVGVAEGLLAENRAWALIKKILGHDPLRDEAVDATPTEILEDFLVLIGKEQHLEQMRERGTVEETANWIATQVETFMGLLGELGGLIDRAWEAIQPENLPDLMTNLQALVVDAGAFLQQVWDFASTVAEKVLELIKNALLGWLATFANDIPGFHLLTVILGRNPFTGERVPRTAVNLIRGFITLLPGGAAIYARLAETGTIARAAARIEEALETLGISWEGIVAVFTGIWDSLAIEDLLDPIGAFTRITDSFGEYIGRLFRFVGVVLREMISIVLEMMNFPSDLIASIISNAMQAMEDVKRDPVGFLLNMLAAVKKGFTSFFDNIGTHLMGGLADWLFRGLRSAGLEPPRDLSLGSVLDFVLQVLGISMERIWEKLADRIGRPVVERVRGAIDRLTGIWTFVKDVQERGVAAIWEHIESQISGLWDMVLSKAQEWVMERVVNRAIQWIASLLDITGIMPVINSFVAFFNAIQSAIEYLRDILSIVNDYVSTIASVARGEIDPGAAKMEQGLANSIPVAIGFLAQQFGLGNIGEKIQEIVAGIRGYVDQALDWLLDRAVSMGQAVLRSLGLGGAPSTPEGADAAAAAEASQEPVDDAAMERWWLERFPFTDRLGESHTLSFSGTAGSASLVVHSDEEQVVAEWLGEKRQSVGAPLRPMVDEAAAAYGRLVVTRTNLEALRTEFEALSDADKDARRAEYRVVYLTFKAALREVGRTFTALPVEGEPDKIELKLPSQKAPDKYLMQKNRNMLQHSRQRPERHTQQVKVWEDLVRPHLTENQMAWAMDTLRLPEFRVLRPNWDKAGNTVEMHVDHIVEWQVRPLNNETMLDDPWNYELLDAASNEASGQAVRGAVESERTRLATDTGDESWRFRDLTFTEVSGGGTAGRRWSFEEITHGDHLEVYRRKHRRPRLEDAPSAESVIEAGSAADDQHVLTETAALSGSALRTLAANHPAEATRIGQIIRRRLAGESWDAIRRALRISQGKLDELRGYITGAGIPL